MQGSMRESHGYKIPIPRELMVAAGVCDERWGCRRCEYNGCERQLHWVDEHEPQLGGVLSGFLQPARPTALLQSHLLQYRRDHRRLQRRSCHLEFWRNLSGCSQFPLISQTPKMDLRFFLLSFYATYNSIYCNVTRPRSCEAGFCCSCLS